MTSSQRQAALRARRKDQGLVRVEVWVPKAYKESIKRIAQQAIDLEKQARVNLPRLFTTAKKKA